MQRLVDRDLLSAMLLFFIGAVGLSAAGSDPRDWALPRLAIYVILAAAAILFAKVIFEAVMKRAPDVVRLVREDRPVYMDLTVFAAIVVCWMLVMFGLGFWLASFFMLSATSIYLTQEKTGRNILLAFVVPLAACCVAFFVFLHVFYVPLPDASWWAGFR